MSIIKYDLSGENLTSFVTEFNTYYEGKFTLTLDTSTGSSVYKITDTNSNPLIDISFGGTGTEIGIYLYRNGTIVESHSYGQNMHRYPTMLMASNGFIISGLASRYNSSYRYWWSGLCAINIDGTSVVAVSPCPDYTGSMPAPTTIKVVEPLNSLNNTATISLTPNTTTTPTVLCNIWTEGAGVTQSAADHAYLYVATPYVSNIGIITLNNKQYATNGYWCIRD